MCSLISFTILIINTHWLIYAIYLFTSLIFLQLIFITCITLRKKIFEKNKKSWTEIISEQISQAIFYEENDTVLINVKSISAKLLRKRAFRQLFIDEIIQTKKSFTGTASFNLKKLYTIFKLGKDSGKKLKSRKWQIKSKGIQELALMEETTYVKKFFRLSNNKNEMVRNEAQCGLVSLYGFLGLRFLNVTTRPVSEWQQIQLLNKLNGITPANFSPMQKWLLSPNESVVEFSIKLAAFYNNYAAYASVIKCLQQPQTTIKLAVLEYLKKMAEEDACNDIIAAYMPADKTCKLAILATLKEIGNEKQIPFLLLQLHHEDDDIKAAAAKSISLLHPGGSAFLQTQLYADQHPWKTIYLQINNEKAA